MMDVTAAMYGQRLSLIVRSTHAAGGLNEVLQARWHLVVLRNASAQLVGDVHGDIAGPALGGVEGHDANRAAILAVDQVADQRRAVGRLFVGARPSRPPKSSWLPAAL